MEVLNRIFLISIFALFISSCSSPTKEEATFVTQESTGMANKEITYSANGKTMKGFLAIPEGEGPFPGVIVVHEWWGQNEYPRERARMLAKNGYVAFAVDMYGDGKTVDHPKEATEFSSAVMSDLDAAEKSFRAALETLKKESSVDPNNIAAIGYCFGGAIVLEMARRGVDMKMVASYHGNLSPIADHTVEPMKTRILIFNGADDSFVTKETIAKARQNLKSAKIRYKYINYKDAKHGFTNTEADNYGKKHELPLAYNKRADEDSWNQTLNAFKVVFK